MSENVNVEQSYYKLKGGNSKCYESSKTRFERYL